MLSVEWYEEDKKEIATWVEARNLRRGRMDLPYGDAEYFGPKRPADVKKTGKLLKVAYQQKQVAIAGVGQGWGKHEAGVSAKWVALVVRDDDGRIVEMDPLKLSRAPH